MIRDRGAARAGPLVLWGRVQRRSHPLAGGPGPRPGRSVPWVLVGPIGRGANMIDSRIAQGFLAGHRIAVVGASDEPKNFGGVILRALVDHGYDPVPVNPIR